MSGDDRTRELMRLFPDHDPQALRRADRLRRAAYQLMKDCPWHPVKDWTPHDLARFIEQYQSIVSADGVAESAASRKNKNAERDRRIHDARESGQAPKQIAADNNLSVSTVNRILRTPRP